MTTIIPPPPRTPEALISAVDAEDVEHNELYRQGRLQPGTTWCNLFVTNVTKRLGCEVPFVLVNKQGIHLREEANKWRSTDAVTARLLANRGYPVLAIWEGLNDAHGHIAVLLPSSTLPTNKQSQVAIAQSGATNFARGRLANGFDSLPVLFFAHD